MDVSVARQSATVAYVLEHVLPRVRDLERHVGARLEGVLGTELKVHGERLEGLAAGDPERSKVLGRGETLLGEVLAFLNGAAARGIGLDEGICAVAEHWLDELSERAKLPPVGVVVPAQDEFVHTLAQVVRLRWPGEGLWALPIAAHEYGHFVAYVLAEGGERRGLPFWVHPVQAQLHAMADEQEWPALFSVGHELFADAFASFVTGPAFAFACCALRFDAAAPDSPLLTHPTPAQRMQVILGVLDQMAITDRGQGWLKSAGDRIALAWSSARSEAGASSLTMLPPELDTLVQQFWALLTSNTQTRLMRYTTFDNATRLATRLEEPPGTGAATVADVLNALWWRWDTELARRPLDPPIGDAAERLAEVGRSRLAEVFGA